MNDNTDRTMRTYEANRSIERDDVGYSEPLKSVKRASSKGKRFKKYSKKNLR